MAASVRSSAMQKEREEVSRCVYCGKESDRPQLKVKVKERSFAVCSESCKADTEAYLAKDKKLKTVLYLIIFAAAIVILFTAITGAQMLFANIMQIAVGIAFFLLPYPVSAFTTFQNCPIKTVVRITRVIGVFLAVFGVILVLNGAALL